MRTHRFTSLLYKKFNIKTGLHGVPVGVTVAGNL